jgi:hypothetical protein
MHQATTTVVQTAAPVPEIMDQNGILQVFAAVILPF